MFTTFGITTPNSSSGDNIPPAAAARQRPKRAQVARACDWCRLTRVKCDNVRPCRNCKNANRECTNGSRDDFKSVAAATREVQRLRAQVKELESKLMEQPDTKAEDKPQFVRWHGVSIDKVHHGPSSLRYFIHRLSTFTNVDFQIPSALRSLPTETHENPQSCNRLQRSQQDYFLDLFWQGYHAVYPVIDEAEFRKHYDSLWSGTSLRQASPLVDIVMALCVQFGSTYTLLGQPAGVDFPGHEFYLRAQRHLSLQSETPSLSTVQTMFFSCIYHLAIDQKSSAYAMVATAIRTAQMLGLEKQPTENKTMGYGIECRLWQCLVILDTQLSIHLGHPSHANHGQIDHEPPETSTEVATLHGPSYVIDPNTGVNWLSFHTQRLRLSQVVLDIHNSFQAVCNRLLDDANLSDFYGHPVTREKCATYLSEQMKKLETWVQELPTGLKTSRINGKSYSNDRSILDLGPTEPLWLQRQRFILELDYHCYCIALRRSFVSFLPAPALGTLSSDNHCIAGVNHAITVTNILHQVLTNTDILTRWYQAMDWQITAAYGLAGFACGYPICPPTPPARKALAMSASLFDLLGSEEMAALVRNMNQRSREIIGEFTKRLGICTPEQSPPDTDKNETNTAEAPPQPFLQLGTSVIAPDFDVLHDAAFDGLWTGEGTSGSLLWGDLMKEFENGNMFPVDDPLDSEAVE